VRSPDYLISSSKVQFLSLLRIVMRLSREMNFFLDLKQPGKRLNIRLPNGLKCTLIFLNLSDYLMLFCESKSQ